VVLSGDLESLDVERSARLRERLYERIAYLHAAHSELGERYRVANQTASRFVHKLERGHLAERRFGELRRDLHHFFRAGQEDKLRLAA
jgi:DNA-binding MarR family transcriptional regulator